MRSPRRVRDGYPYSRGRVAEDSNETHDQSCFMPINKFKTSIFRTSLMLDNRDSCISSLMIANDGVCVICKDENILI